MNRAILIALFFLFSSGVHAEDDGCSAASKEIKAFFVEQGLPAPEGDGIQSYRAKVLMACTRLNQVCVYGDPVDVDVDNGGEAGTLWVATRRVERQHLQSSKEVTQDHPMAYAGVIDLGVRDDARICLAGAAPTARQNLWFMIALKLKAGSVSQIAWHPFYQGEYLAPDQFASRIVQTFEDDMGKKGRKPL
jgi:hypothetical protein